MSFCKKMNSKEPKDRLRFISQLPWYRNNMLTEHATNNPPPTPEEFHEHNNLLWQIENLLEQFSRYGPFIPLLNLRNGNGNTRHSFMCTIPRSLNPEIYQNISVAAEDNGTLLIFCESGVEIRFCYAPNKPSNEECIRRAQQNLQYIDRIPKETEYILWTRKWGFVIKHKLPPMKTPLFIYPADYECAYTPHSEYRYQAATELPEVIKYLTYIHNLLQQLMHIAEFEVVEWPKEYIPNMRNPF